MSILAPFERGKGGGGGGGKGNAYRSLVFAFEGESSF